MATARKQKRTARTTAAVKRTSAARTGKRATKRTVAKTTSTAAKRPAHAPSRQEFLGRLGREHGVTLKVMRAFPSHEAGFQPHPRSQPAKKLMWTFVQEQALAIAALDGTLGQAGSMGTEPDTVVEVIEAYDAGVRQVVERLTGAADADLSRTVKFYVGPGQMGDIPLMDFLWMMLMDSIHHRGQLSVYVRMAGGLVPSIYGPSADEPWN